MRISYKWKMISTKVTFKIHQSKELAEKKQQNQLWSEKSTLGKQEIGGKNFQTKSTDLNTKMCQRLTTIKGDYMKSKEASWTTAKKKNKTIRPIELSQELFWELKIKQIF